MNKKSEGRGDTINNSLRKKNISQKKYRKKRIAKADRSEFQLRESTLAETC